MNIDFYISSLSGGGAEKVLTTLSEEFAKRGHRVSITSLEKRPQFYSVGDDVELIKYDNTKKGGIKSSISDFRAIRKQLKVRKNTDVSISFLSRCNLMVLLCSAFLGKKIIVCDRNNPLKEHSSKFFKLSCLIYRLASAIIVQTEQIKQYYPDYLQKKIYVLENPIDTKKLESQLEGEDILKENSIISVGRLEPQKDFKTLIKAFSVVAGDFPDWKVKIFGKGDMHEELQSYIDRFGLNEQVILCGRTEKPFLELKKSKVFVLSSHYEGFPNALCEGMCAGLACISSDCVSGPRELIDDGKNGFLFGVGDADALSDRLKTVLSSAQLREDMGMKAEKTVKRLELSSIADKWYNTVECVKNEK